MSKKLGQDVQRARLRAHMSGRELARRADVTDSWIRQLESGRMGKPSAKRLAAVADVLGLPLEPMLAMTDQLGVVVASPKPPPIDMPALAAIMERQTAILERLAGIAEEQAAALRSLAAGRDAAAIPPDAGAEIEAAYQQALRSGYRPLQYEFDPTEDRETGEIDRRAE